MKDFPIVYKCDFEKNVDCPKTCCQKYCFFTFKEEFSIDGKRYKYNANTGREEDLDAGQ